MKNLNGSFEEYIDRKFKASGAVSENEFILLDRLTKIKDTILKYGEDNFYISFSGGKDSCVLSALVDYALPENKIPRVYINTGIELNMIRTFVEKMREEDSRVEIIQPKLNIKDTLEKYGYPFKSKKHAKKLGTFQRHGYTKTAEEYLGSGRYSCPKCLRYQFTDEFTSKLKVDYQCCVQMKEKPLILYGKKNNKPYSLVGIMKDEGGGRQNATCLAFTNTKKGKVLKNFQPLVPVTKEWEEWFIKEFDIKICDIYYPPYNFVRTGCKGCPFALNLKHELETLEQFFPAERKQCELIWKPVYDEYRRIGYRIN